MRLATGSAIEAPPLHSKPTVEKSERSYKFEKGFCLAPCKIFGPNRTKMFHVKHFCKARTARNEPRLVGFADHMAKGASRRPSWLQSGLEHLFPRFPLFELFLR